MKSFLIKFSLNVVLKTLVHGDFYTGIESK